MKKLSLVAASFLMPFFTFAADGISDVAQTLFGLLQDIVPIIFVLAIIFFMMGVLQLILKAGEPEERKKALSKIMWGIVALFLLVSFWGIIAILQNTFGINSGLQVHVPGAPF